MKGSSEVGLPPYKPGVYEAKYDDVRRFVASVFEALNSHAAPSTTSLFDGALREAAAAGITDLLPLPRSMLADEHPLCVALATVLAAADTCPESQAGNPYLPACMCGVEVAVMDAWAQVAEVPVWSLLGLSYTPAAPDSPRWSSFYTAALNDDVSKVAESAQFGSRFTPHLKIKLSDDYDHCEAVLRGLYEALSPTYAARYSDGHVLWSVDANSCWTPRLALKWLGELRRLSAELPCMDVVMLEQPFPADLSTMVG